jgi:hypothetical protein
MLYLKMRFIAKLTVVFTTALVLQSCTQGIDGGSIEKTFVGIQRALVLGPETVEISWLTNSSCSSYQIYSTASNDFIMEKSVPPARVPVTSETPYTFSVACVKNGNKLGQDVTMTVNTWKKFDSSITGIVQDGTSNSKIVKLNWTYPKNLGVAFNVYVKQSIIPGDGQNWVLTRNNITGGFSETPFCTIYDTEARIGAGGNCSNATQSLTSGQTYHFKVVAQYPDASYSSDLAGNFTSVLMPSTFKEPSCILTKMGLSADVDTAFLTLRCGSNAFDGMGCSNNSFDIKAYQVVGNSRNSISDRLSGPGSLKIYPTISSTAINSRKVQGLEIEYTCTSLAGSPKLIVRYDNSDANHLQPFLKYGNVEYEKTPKQSYVENPSRLGKSMAVGDFNCNGKPDLAIGLPEITYNKTPYFNRQSNSGAVKIIFDYADSATSAANFSNAQNVQYLSFRDLPSGARFGSSLSAGNINKDVAKGDGDVYYNCDDLIIGAPGWLSSQFVGGSRFTGAAFVFYGHPNKFARPTEYNTLATNLGTCEGDFDGKVCQPVRLSPDVTGWLRVHQDYTTQGTANNRATGGMNTGTSARSSFGHQVAYIRDYNADGYGDIAISDPYCDMDGEITPGRESNNNGSRRIALREVGCVYVYWGGPQGLQIVDMGPTPETQAVARIASPFAIVYPPIPQAGMHFGMSIAGGGDVNAAAPVPVKIEGNNLILASGHDFIVGAPDFSYNPINNGVAGDPNMGTTTAPAWMLSADTVDPSVLVGPANFNDTLQSPTQKITVPWNLGWDLTLSNWVGRTTGAPLPTTTPLQNSTGIAFLYLGRTSLVNYQVALNTGFSKTPKLITNSDSVSNGLKQLSNSLYDRQNGSQRILWPTDSTYDYKVNPVASFYNCGPRGNPRGADQATGFYKGISCLAGRNNVSWIFPTLSATDSAVSGFGSSVTIAGAKEQNLIALYYLNQGNEGLYAIDSTTGSDVLVPRKQDKIHESIRGTSLWEAELPGLNRPTAEVTDLMTATSGAQQTTNLVNVSIARSAVRETYSLASTAVPSRFQPLTDANNDGYADVAIATRANANQSYLFGYYGNYAADFSYASSTSGTASCSIASAPNQAVDDNTGMKISLTNINAVEGSTVPYATFKSALKVIKNTNSSIQFDHPYYYFPAGNLNKELTVKHLDDLSPSQTPDFNYLSTITRNGNSTQSAAAISRCKPMKTLLTGSASFLAAGDTSNDGFVDLLLGIPNDNGVANSTGKTVTMVSNSTGKGFQTQSEFIFAGSANSTNGTAIAFSQWKFIDESQRRDLFSGAPGYAMGAGATFHYSVPGTDTLQTTSFKNQLTDDVNSPNDLFAHLSKVIGDINGDGFEDVLVPVRRVGTGGNTYFEGIVYFGSELGLISPAVCKKYQSTIKTFATDAAIQSTDCEGTVSPVVAKLDQKRIVLPQYFSRPSSVVTASWLLNFKPAGDVNGDGYDDLLVIDLGNATENTRLVSTSFYLYFGSLLGLKNEAAPALGPSINLRPQLVMQNRTFFSAASLGLTRRLTSSFHFGSSDNRTVFSNGNISEQNQPVAFGDFNNDGRSDLVLGMPHFRVPGKNQNWICSAADFTDDWNGVCFSADNTIPVASRVSPGAGHGAVMVLYGSANGYQTPSNNGAPVDYPNLELSGCSDFYQFRDNGGCIYSSDSALTQNSVQEVYESLTYNNNWLIDSARRSCQANGACKTTMIRNPVFYDFTSANNNVSGMASNLVRMNFGSSFTVADINGDGVDDLLVGMPRYWLPSNTGAPNVTAGFPTSLTGPLPATGYAQASIPATTIANANQINQGRVFIYYGANQVGLVAPHAKQMVGDLGLGLNTNGTNALTNTNTLGNIPFALYPRTSSGNTPVPALDRDTNASSTFAHRNFGVNLSPGDFNGDGIDDVAISSQKGQIYVYYGPVCAFDNDVNALENVNYGMYRNNNLVSTVTQNDIASNCQRVNLGGTLTLANLTASTISTKRSPQMITMPGVSNTQYFGSLMLSRRPLRKGGVTKYPGNINGDSSNTSDLVIGDSTVNDPNITPVSGKSTGVGFVLFGHKTAQAGTTEMPTREGLYVGDADYKSAITSVTTNGVTNYFYMPVLLRPHTSDSLTSKFMKYESTLGDVNGDGTGDLVLPTTDIHQGEDNTPLIDGGGFKLVY